MYDFSVPMALADYIPVVIFAVVAVILQRDLYNKMPNYAFACFAAGTVNAFTAGFLKATWKLLYAVGICDFHVLNTMFLPTQSLGLLLTGFGILLMLRARKHATLAVVPPIFQGTFVFVAMMVLGLGAMCGGLGILAVKMKKKWLLPVFSMCFLCYMAIGYLASRDVASAVMNWVEQGVNCLGQILLLAGTLVLHRAGLREFDLSADQTE